MWHKDLEKYYLIKSIYSEVPELKQVKVHEIKISDNGKKASLTFDMPDFAEYPPTQWIREGFNTTKVTCEMLNIESFTVNYKKSKCICDIEIFKKDKVNIKITGDISAELCAEIGLIKEVNGYIDSEKF